MPDDRISPSHPRHRELMLGCCPNCQGSGPLAFAANFPHSPIRIGAPVVLRSFPGEFRVSQIYRDNPLAPWQIVIQKSLAGAWVDFGRESLTGFLACASIPTA